MRRKIHSPQTVLCGYIKTVLGQALKLLHPFMPFITEEIYGALVPEEESLMMSVIQNYLQSKYSRNLKTVDAGKTILFFTMRRKDVADDAASIVVPGTTVYRRWRPCRLRAGEKRLKKEEERLNSEIKRAQGMLTNERFTNKSTCR